MTHGSTFLASSHVVLFACAAAAGACGGGTVGMVEKSTDPPSAGWSCEELTALDLPDTTITLAELVPAGLFLPPGGADPIEVPSSCRVVGVTTPAVNFEVWLPDDWNGKYQGVGNGGMAGTILYERMPPALARGYATASTDTGHTAGDGAFDASWAAGHPELIEDFGHRALHVTTVNGKAITAAFYGEPPRYAYYTGCSKGGQQGLMEAQRYPDDFDGLVAGNPANDWTGLYAGAHLWFSLATLDDPESYLPADKLPLLEEAVNHACDALDGVEDGVLNDPRRCDFDPAVLTCAAGDDPATCLTPKQVTAVEALWSGVKDSSGDLVYPGLVPGGEAAPGGWSRWVTGNEAFGSIHWRAGEGFFKHMVFEDPEWDFRTFDYDTDLAFAIEKLGPVLDANDPDLRALRDRGGKLLVYHGWSDADISPLATIDYYQRVVSELTDGEADATGLAEVQEFFRLFMVPGMGHCRGGPGPDQFDALSALEAWVEDGVAPDQIVASKVEDGEVVRSRPLCPFPQVAEWTGSGSTDDAANFVCAAGNSGH